jgi:diguanylate cyclase (GGDEF)-like protein
MTDSMRNMSVLIVDDVPINIQVLAEALRADYRVRIAANGAKALSIAMSDDQPDIILLDIMMPEMDGYAICRALKNNPKTIHIPVIFVTAKTDSEAEAMGLNLGAVDYITKPFSIPVVKARVRNHLQLKMRTDMLERMALVDGLTGIANRRSFNESLHQEWKRAARNNMPLSVIMIDIDHFKPYNDNYGHGTGDDCLQRVAEALRDAMQRPSDIIARYGGEEFAALLPETDSQGADMVARKLLQSVADLRLPHEHSPVADHVTISVGHATGRATPDKTPDDLLQAADNALYKAKESGRNQVQAAPPDRGRMAEDGGE